MCSGTGGYAEYAVSDWGRVMPIPDDMSFEEAATLPVSLITLHNALVTAGRLQPGDSVLIQGASSGVGLMGLQIAKLMGAKLVIGTSTNADRRARLKEFGADLAIDTRDPAWPDQVLKATDGKGVNVVVDMLSGPLVSPTDAGDGAARPDRQCRPARRHQCRVRLRPACAAAHRIYRRHLPHPHASTRCAVISRLMRADLWDAVKAGKLKLPIDRASRSTRCRRRTRACSDNKHFGKIVLTM